MDQNAELARQQQIEVITGQYRQRFLEWRNNSHAFQTLDVPQEVGNVFIPKRIFEVVGDPERVQAELLYAEGHGLDIAIFEKDGHKNLSNRDITYLRLLGVPVEQLEQTGEVTSDMDIDALDLLNWEQELGMSTILPKDKLLIWYQLFPEPDYPSVLFSDNYRDRKNFRGIGVGSSFYDNLDRILPELGYNFLAGRILSQHPEFYQKRRSKYGDLPEDIQKQLPPKYGEDPQVMIKVLPPRESLI